MVDTRDRNALQIGDELAVLGLQPGGIGRTRSIRYRRARRRKTPDRVHCVHSVDRIGAAAPYLYVRFAIGVRIAGHVGRREGARVGGRIGVEYDGAACREGVRDLGIDGAAGSAVTYRAGAATVRSVLSAAACRSGRKRGCQGKERQRLSNPPTHCGLRAQRMPIPLLRNVELLRCGGSNDVVGDSKAPPRITRP